MNLRTQTTAFPLLSLLATSACALLAMQGSAQVPDGHYVVSTIDASGSGSAPGPGGLFVVDPRVPGPPTVIQGLSQELTGWPGASVSGANSVVLLADDRLLVGEVAPPGQMVDLHFLTLSGTSVINDQKVPVGLAAPTSPLASGAVMTANELPQGEFLVTLTGLVDTPPLNGNQLAIVSPNGAIRPLGNVRGDYANAAVFHPARQSVFVSVFSSGPNRVGSLLEIDFPSGASQRFVTRVDGNTALAIDSEGLVVANRVNSVGRQELIRLEPSTGAVVSVCNGATNGMAIEPATDRAVYATGGGLPTGIAKVGYFDPITCRVELTRQLSGVASGIDVAENPRVYGEASGAARFHWRTAPNPGGLPRVGSTAFGLQVDGPTAPGGLFVSLRSANQTLGLGLQLLVDPNSGFPLPIPVTPGNPIALPIPASTPVGVSLHFQSFHLVSGNQLAASDGVRVTPLR